MPQIPLKRLTPDDSYFISARGFTAPVDVIQDGRHTLIIIRQGGVLGVELEDISRKLSFAPDKVRELQEKGKTRI